MSYNANHYDARADEDIVDVLTAISVVSKRLASNLTIARQQSKFREEENHMSRMSDMAQTIEELRSAAAAISDAADWLTKVFSSEPQAEDAPASPPEPELTLEQVRAVLADKSRQGHTAEIRALLQKYGASKLSQIDPAHYKALLAEAEVLTNGS